MRSTEKELTEQWLTKLQLTELQLTELQLPEQMAHCAAPEPREGQPWEARRGPPAARPQIQ